MVQESAFESNWDGLVAPYHNYAGLSLGNLASMEHRNFNSYPKKAALQGIAKIKLLADLGIKQGVLPIQKRPSTQFLTKIGFRGNEKQLLSAVAKSAPHFLPVVYSSSSMWAANSALVSPSIDCEDGRMHITPANLLSTLHRSLESYERYRIFKQIFNNEKYFAVHEPLPPHMDFADEGAANHNRLCNYPNQAGLEIFVFGRDTSAAQPQSGKYPARQTLQAQTAIARLHQLKPLHTLFVQQNPLAIAQGAFHNDVVSVSHQNFFLFHEHAFYTRQIFAKIQEWWPKENPLYLCEVKEAELSLTDAVRSYLFNSQIISLPDKSMALIAPMECQIIPSAQRVIERLLGENNPLKQVFYVDLRESMQNGGGPACLRLRIVLNKEEYQHTHPSLWFNEKLHRDLLSWVDAHFREELHPQDLADPLLYEESMRAYEDLMRILKLTLDEPARTVLG